MPTALTLRPLDGAPLDVVVGDDGHFADPATAGAPTAELDTARWFASAPLADCHAHLSGGEIGSQVPPEEIPDFVAGTAWAQLSAGVFLVADKGTHDELALRIQDRPPSERPDLHMAGRVLTAPGGYYGGFAREVDPADLAGAVRAAAATGGASWVKLIGDWPRKGVGAVPNFGQDALTAAVDVAHAADCRVAIHACAPDTSSMAVAAGVDSIEHGLFLTADDVTALGARGGAWVPTIAAMEGVAEMLGPESSGGRLFVDGLRNVAGLLAGAPAVGVAVLAGSDLHLPHGAVAQEALKLADYGLSPAAVVDAMTDVAYRYLGQHRGWAPGDPADVVFFDADPREDLTVLQRPVALLRHGRLLTTR